MRAINKKDVIYTWIRSGIIDFFISFEFEDRRRWHTYSTFLCHQGLEKICKAYFLDHDWETESFEDLDTINKYAKQKGHKISDMITKLRDLAVLPHGTFDKKVEGYPETDLISVLEKSHIEARYPVPRESFEDFPISHESLQLYHNPITETAPIKYARRTASTIIRKIEEKHSISILQIMTRDIISSKITNEEWERFTNLLFNS